MRYQDWLEEWLAVYIKPTSKYKTYHRYEAIIRQRLIPKLGGYDLQDLTPLLIQRYIMELLQSGNLKNGMGLSVNSVDGILSVIQNSLKTAYAIELIPNYTMNKIKRPKIAEKQVSCFSAEEQKTIEKAVMKDKRDKMKGIILCLYTGLRIGELLALEWEDIDFSRAELIVNKTEQAQVLQESNDSMRESLEDLKDELSELSEDKDNIHLEMSKWFLCRARFCLDNKVGGYRCRSQVPEHEILKIVRMYEPIITEFFDNEEEMAKFQKWRKEYEEKERLEKEEKAKKKAGSTNVA